MSQMSRNPQAYDIIWIFNLQCDGAITKNNESTNGISFELIFSIVGTNGWSKEYDEFNEEYEC